MKFVPAATVSLETYAAAITSSFEGYPVQINFTAPMLARRVRFEQHDLESSLLVLDGDEAIGMAGLAIRGVRGWVSGFGVVPSWRRRGLGRRLMSALLERARDYGLRQLTLDVLEGNDGAIRLYESAGLRITRDLLIFERPADYAPRAAGRRRPPSEAPAAELLTHHWRLHPEPPAWQRELPALIAADLRGFYVGGRRRPRAYALVGYGRGDGNTYLSDLAAADEAGAEAMCAALGRVAGPTHVINEPERSPYVAPLLAHGFSVVLRQHQMSMEL
ncbi:MAG TPA: GNAT family N-acetyltransferase [Pyrinomonadaceae bacterium]